MFDSIKKFVWEYKKILILAFFAGVFLPNLYAPSFQSSVIDYNDKKYGDDVEQAIIDYHVKVNELVNEKIKILLEEDKPSVLYVESAGDCSGSNVSTYCLAVVLNDELFALQSYLIGHLDDVVTTGVQTDDVGDESAIDYSDLSDVIEISSLQKNLVLDEMQAAEDTMDLLLSVYNQLQIVYPIHKALNSKDDASLMKALEELNNSLADVRKEVEQFPAKFNDATMVECK